MAIRARLLSAHIKNPDVLVVEELGLEHGAVRADIAVITQLIHGYEIKSASDRLSRLPSQIAAYSRCMDKATLLASECHIPASSVMLPDWWGIKALVIGRRRGISIRTIRHAQRNPDLSPFHLAHLLWRPECIRALEAKGERGRALRVSRVQMYERIVEIYSLNDLRAFVRSALRDRTQWR